MGKGDKITSTTHPGIVYRITGFNATHVFAADKHGVVRRFKRSIVSKVS